MKILESMNRVEFQAIHAYSIRRSQTYISNFKWSVTRSFTDYVLFIIVIDWEKWRAMHRILTATWHSINAKVLVFSAVDVSRRRRVRVMTEILFAVLKDIMSVNFILIDIPRASEGVVVLRWLRLSFCMASFVLVS